MWMHLSLGASQGALHGVAILEATKKDMFYFAGIEKGLENLE